MTHMDKGDAAENQRGEDESCVQREEDGGDTIEDPAGKGNTPLTAAPG